MSDCVHGMYTLVSFHRRCTGLCRDEICFYEGLVHSLANMLWPGAEVVACGSYRRGRPDGGDCDLIVTHPDGGRRSLVRLVDWLIRLRVITHVFGNKFEALRGQRTELDSEDDYGDAKGGAADGTDDGGLHNVMAVCQFPLIRHDKLDVLLDLFYRRGEGVRPNRIQELPEPVFRRVVSFVGGTFRRLDLKSCTWRTLPFMSLYFTGRYGMPSAATVAAAAHHLPARSDHFNRSMRDRADRLGLTLNHEHLETAVRVGGEKVANGDPVQCATEADIFTALGLDYVHPHERWRHFTMKEPLTLAQVQGMRRFGTVPDMYEDAYAGLTDTQIAAAAVGAADPLPRARVEEIRRQQADLEQSIRTRSTEKGEKGKPLRRGG